MPLTSFKIKTYKKETEQKGRLVPHPNEVYNCKSNRDGCVMCLFYVNENQGVKVYRSIKKSKGICRFKKSDGSDIVALPHRSTAVIALTKFDFWEFINGPVRPAYRGDDATFCRCDESWMPGGVLVQKMRWHGIAGEVMSSVSASGRGCVRKGR